MELIKSIKQSSRGKGKGFAWTIEVNTPALIGNIDAHDIGAVAASEVIELIRDRWKNGRRVDGTEAVYHEQTQRLRRQAEKYILENNPRHEGYQQYVKDWIAPQLGWKVLVVGRTRRKLMISKKNFNKWKHHIFKGYTARVPAGELGKKATKRNYVPDPTAHGALFGSGLMIDNLRGKMRTARKGKIGDKTFSINEHVEIRLPVNRQRAGAWVGGLTQSGIDNTTRTLQHMPETKATLDNAVAWQQPGQTAANALFVLRLTYRVLKLMS